tara:strand:+ start:283 stop:996 length:714 start_codon:yes stop_codon:yes gene_type:complete
MYNKKNYIDRHSNTEYSAKSIIDLLINEINEINSCVDVGCGVGTWLAELNKRGASRIQGIEGTWLAESHIVIPPECIKKYDLNKRIILNSTYDLAISLEVAEHLLPERAKSFVDDLCNLSSIILFSAAVPGQKDKTHINEQWPEYWASLFKERGYNAYDFIRWKIWNDEHIPYWYRQNIILYINKSVNINENIKKSLCDSPLSVVHPILLKSQSDLSVGQALKIAGISLINSLKKKF